MKGKLKTISIVLTLVLLLNIFVPTMKVIATEFGTGDFELTVEVDTRVKANGMQLEAQSTINQYTFIMPDANVHFSAEFKETKDIVKANSEKVSSGSIELGNTLSGGSAQLTVSDVELTSDKISGI